MQRADLMVAVTKIQAETCQNPQKIGIFLLSSDLGPMMGSSSRWFPGDDGETSHHNHWGDWSAKSIQLISLAACCKLMLGNVLRLFQGSRRSPGTGPIVAREEPGSTRAIPIKGLRSPGRSRILRISYNFLAGSRFGRQFGTSQACDGTLGTARRMTEFWRSPTWSARLALLVWVWQSGLSASEAQVRIVPAPPQVLRSAESQNGVFLPYDRTLSRGIQQARERIANGEYSQAIRFLDEVLRPEQEDSFVVASEASEFAGLKETARRILSELPEDGRQLYEATFGSVARRELQRAIAAGDHEGTRRVAHRYFHTSAGYEAAMLLAQHEADMGRHLSAALAYEELLKSPPAADRFEPQLSLLAAEAWLAANNQQQAESLLSHLHEQGHRAASIAGQQVGLEALGRQPIDWLLRTAGAPAGNQPATELQWLTRRGNANRNGQVEGGLPHMRVRWAVRLLSHPDLEEVCDNLNSEMMRQERSLPVAAAPLAVGDYVIARSAHNLIAVDYRTGKRVWQAQPQRVPQFEPLISATSETAEDQSDVEPTRAFAERIWRDSLYNSISSDGERVYVIRDLALPTTAQIDPFGIPGMGFDESKGDPARSNRLCAYELATQGKLVWEIDGAASREELAGAFFLGAPLAIGQSLYGLAEMKSAIYVVALDRSTGQLQWQQQLVSLEADILLDTPRRLQGAVPSYDAGILVCPTGAGVVVGVDLAKHALAWAYRYDADRSVMNVLRMRQEPDLGSDGRWLDNALIVAEGRVLLSPPESDFLHCLDLVSGKLLWKIDRDNSLFVAGVDGQRVLLVGNRKLAAVDLKTGKAAWKRGQLDLPQGALPSGRGFFSQGRYYLPLSTAVVLAIDVENGVETERAVARDGEVLGNLICHRGAVLSQTGLFLDCFDQVDVLRTKSELSLAKNPQDYTALRTLGEIAYNEGRLPEAIGYLERALGSESESLRTKEVLIDCLEVALNENFAAYQGKLPLLRELEQTSARGQMSLLRLQAQGLLEIGDPQGAFQACLQLYQSTDNPLETLAIGRDYEVQLSRWLRAQVEAIWDNAAEKDRKQIARQVNRLLEQQTASQDDARLRRIADCFQVLEMVEPSLLRLAGEHMQQGRLLAAQQLYLLLAHSDDERIRAEAIARCSQMLHQRQLPRLAQKFDEQLRQELSDVVCVDGKTGLECLTEWGSGEMLGGLTWPYGEAEVTALPTRGRSAARQGRSPLSRIRLERTDDVLGRGNVFISIRGAEVIARDSVGQDFFSAPLEKGDRIQMLDPSNYYGVSRGNLLVVSQGSQIVAFDTLASGEADQNPILWRTKVANRIDDRYRMRVTINARDARRPAPSQAPRAQQDDLWSGVIGPLTHDSCIFQDQRRLVCVDSLSGEVRWWRSDVPLGSDLFGDEQYVFAVPRDSKQALVFSTIDGRVVGEATVPSWNEQLATIGRQVIRWHKQTNGRRELSAVDAFSGAVLWKHEFEIQAPVDVAEGRYVGVVEPSGRCAIVDATSGELLVDHQLEAQLKVRKVFLLAGSDNFVLVAQQPPQPAPDRPVSPVNQLDYQVIDGKVIVFDRRTGQAAWSRSADVRQESFILSQPVDLPVVAFAGNVNRRNAGGGRQTISLLLLEKASGRLLFHDDTLPPSPNYCELKVVDERSPKMAVEMNSQTIQLSFTDRPRPPEPPAIVGGASVGKNGASGLYEITRKLFGGD